MLPLIPLARCHRHLRTRGKQNATMQSATAKVKATVEDLHQQQRHPLNSEQFCVDHRTELSLLLLMFINNSTREMGRLSCLHLTENIGGMRHMRASF